MRYRSKKDTWLVALLCGVTLLLFALGILYLLLPGIPRGAAWLVLFIGIALPLQAGLSHLLQLS